MPHSALSQRITNALTPFVQNHQIAGAVTLVADKNHTISLDAVGYADIAAHALMRPDTVFWVASQTKPVTATALMLLVDEGKINLDDSVTKFLPEFQHQWLAVEQSDEQIILRKPLRPITVRDLLSHTSGMAFASILEEPTSDLLPLSARVRGYALTPLQSEPGSRYAYSNAGINTAGRIIEVVSGLAFETFLQERLLDPLGMTDTSFWPNASQLSRLAKPYMPGADNQGLEETTVYYFRYPLSDPTRQPSPGGGLFSTAEDMGRFCRMILNGGVFEGRQLVSESSVREMTRKQTGAGIPDGYGLGWAVGDGVFGHAGAYSTNMSIRPEPGLITVFLVQNRAFPTGGEQSLSAFEAAALDG